MTNTGHMALESGGPIDFARMRRERLERTLAAMERRQLDVLLLGKPANVKYVSGIRSMFIAGRMGFAPAAIVLRERREVHLMTMWDYGVPPEIPRERLFPTSWNPQHLMDNVRRIVGPARPRRLGVDAMTMFFQRMLGEAFPSAPLADGGTAMLEARAVKTAGEIACLRSAIDIGEAALAEAIAALRPGVPERVLLGAFERKASEMGTTNMVAQGGFCVQPLVRESGDGRPPLRQIVSDRPVQAGELVTMAGGVLYAGYESDVGRTWLCGEGRPSARQRALYARWREALAAMTEACRPGRTAADLRNACQRVTPALAGAPVAHGSGQGFEPPIAGTGLGAEAEARQELQAGMVLVLQPYVWEQGAGGFWAKETALVTEGAPERLTSLSHGPLSS